MNVNLDNILKNLQNKLNVNLKKAEKEKDEAKQEMLFDNINGSNKNSDSFYGDAISISNVAKAIGTTQSTTMTETAKETVKRESATKKVTSEEVILEYDKAISTKTSTIKTSTTRTSTTQTSTTKTSTTKTSTTQKTTLSASSASKPTVEDFNAYKAEKEIIINAYQEKLSNRKLQLVRSFENKTVTEDLTYKSFMAYANSVGQYRIVNKEGNVIVSSKNDIPDTATLGSDGNYYTNDDKKYIIVSDITNSEYFQTALRDENLFIEKKDTNDTKWVIETFQASMLIRDVLDSSDDAIAEVEYEKALVKLENNSKYAKIIKEYDKISEQYIDKTKLAEIQKAYEEKINSKILRFVYAVSALDNETGEEDLSYASLITNADKIGQYRIVTTEGKVVVPSYNYIPQTEIEVPIYTKILQNADGSYKAAMKTETIPTKTTVELGVSSGTNSNGNKIYPEIYLPTNTEDKYVKIQNSDGTLNINATVVDQNHNIINVFSKTGSGNSATIANYTMTSELNKWYKYQMVTTSDIDTRSDFNSAEEAEAAGYIQINGQTKKIMIDRQPINGKYYTDDGKEYIITDGLLNNLYFQTALRQGALIMQKATITDCKDTLGNKVGELVTWSNQSLANLAFIKEINDVDIQVQAEVEYEKSYSKLADEAYLKYLSEKI